MKNSTKTPKDFGRSGLSGQSSVRNRVQTLLDVKTPLSLLEAEGYVLLLPFRNKKQFVDAIVIANMSWNISCRQFHRRLHFSVFIIHLDLL